MNNCRNVFKQMLKIVIIKKSYQIIKEFRGLRKCYNNKRSLNHNDENDDDNILLHIKRFFSLLDGDSSQDFEKEEINNV